MLSNSVRQTTPVSARSPTMIFIHDGRVFRLPVESFILKGDRVVEVSYQDLVGMTNTTVGFCADTFLGASRHPRGLHRSLISVIQTTHGYVWVSRMSVKVPADVRRRNGLTDAETDVGGDIVWAWNVGKAVVSWTRFASASQKDGQYRPLSYACPSRTTVAAGLGPHNVKSCEEVKWEDLTDGQRFFLLHVHPRTNTLTQSNDPLADVSYRNDARAMIERRRKKVPNIDDGAPLPYIVASHNHLLVAEHLSPTMSSLFGLSCAKSRRKLDTYLGTVQHVVYTAEWRILPPEITSLVLSFVAEEAFTSSWNDHSAVESVCALRLVCRDFCATLDTSLRSLWSQHKDFSLRVIKGRLGQCPVALADVGIYEASQMSHRGETWRKLSLLRQVTRAPRKQKTSPFIVEGSVVRMLKFRDVAGDELSQLQAVNPAAHFDNNYLSFS